jgi:hypothetical protein
MVKYGSTTMAGWASAEECNKFYERLEGRGYFLYRLYGRGDTLLYVGLTGNIKARMSDHYKKKPWFRCEVARFTWEYLECCAYIAKARKPLRSFCHEPIRLG